MSEETKQEQIGKLTLEIATHTREFMEYVACSPGEMKAWLGGYLGTLLGLISDEVWEEMVESAHLPCGRPDCDCHDWTGELFDGLSSSRNEWKKHAQPIRPNQ